MAFAVVDNHLASPATYKERGALPIKGAAIAPTVRLETGRIAGSLAPKRPYRNASWQENVGLEGLRALCYSRCGDYPDGNGVFVIEGSFYPPLARYAKVPPIRTKTNPSSRK